jgi:hypothetical protein
MRDDTFVLHLAPPAPHAPPTGPTRRLAFGGETTHSSGIGCHQVTSQPHMWIERKTVARVVHPPPAEKISFSLYKYLLFLNYKDVYIMYFNLF